MKKKYIIIIIVAVLVLTGTIFYFTSRKKDKVYNWRTARVEINDIATIVTATGTINPDTTVSVGTQVSGIISKIFSDFNSIVKKGQIIALIDTTLLVTARDDASAALQRAKAELDETKRQFQRSKTLFEQKVMALAEYEPILTNFEAATATFNSAKAQLNRAKINLQYAVIRAPINGVIISRSVDVGQTVIASFNTPTLFSIANDLTKMQVQANVDEADIGQVKAGQRVNFTVDAYQNDVFTGNVKQVRLQPVPVQNVVNYIVIIEVANTDLKLMPGLTANVNILVLEHKNVLKIPSNALSFVPPEDYIDASVNLPDSVKQKTKQKLTESGQKIIRQGVDQTTGVVWIKEGNDIFPRQIKKGISDGIYTEVSGNIKENEEVITGLNNAAPTTDKQGKSKPSGQQNPFMPKFPPRRQTR